MPQISTVSQYERLFAEAERLATQREKFAQRIKHCPACGGNQLQLVEWPTAVLAKFRCRECKQPFMVPW